MKHLNAILAVDLNHGLGFRNKLPWHVTEDLQFFKRSIRNKSVVMGTKTAYSILDQINGLFPHSKNLVLSHNAENHPALKTAGAEFITLERVLLSQEDIMVIGGRAVYKALIAFCDVIYLTVIHKCFEVDCYFDITVIKNNPDFKLYETRSIFNQHENCKVDFETWHYVEN